MTETNPQPSCTAPVLLPTLVEGAFDYLVPTGTQAGTLVETTLAGRKLVGAVWSADAQAKEIAAAKLKPITRVIDSITHLETVTKQAIVEIGQQHGYAPDWLNDQAAAFRPIGLTTQDCTIVFDHPTLTVLGPSPDWIFLMKLYAGRTIDHQDLTRLWPLTNFTTTNKVIQQFRNAYPSAPDDPYLAEYVDTIRHQAEAPR